MSSFSSTGEHCTAPAVLRHSKDCKGRGPQTTLAIQSEPQPTRPGGAGKASSGKPPMTAKGVISLLQVHRTFPKAGCRHKTRSCLKCNADKERVLKTSCLPRSLSSAPRLFKRRSQDLCLSFLFVRHGTLFCLLQFTQGDGPKGVFPSQSWLVSLLA